MGKEVVKSINQILQGDCIELMQQLPNNAIDLILCDLPYGVTQNDWDIQIPFPALWNQYKRVIKYNGAIVLTSQGIFTGQLIMSNVAWFKYKIVWIKSTATNFLNAKKQPLHKHEDICVFYNAQPTYHPQMEPGKPYDKGIRKKQAVDSYGAFEQSSGKSKGGRYPTDILPVDPNHDDYVYVKSTESEGRILHPTQKPIVLGRYLVRTYSNPGDIVLDNACGAGSFLIAAAMEGRNYIGMEKYPEIRLHGKPVDLIQICRDRLKNIQSNLGL